MCRETAANPESTIAYFLDGMRQSRYVVSQRECMDLTITHELDGARQARYVIKWT